MLTDGDAGFTGCQPSGSARIRRFRMPEPQHLFRTLVLKDATHGKIVP